jgi:hypothetical protein
MGKYFGSIFGRASEATELKLETPFTICISRKEFCKIKVETLYKKILHRCYSRSEGAEDQDKIASLFDSTERSGAQRGLISLLAMAMTCKHQIGIIYDSGVVRLADYKEKEKIIKDYQKNAKSEKGILVDFTNYCLTDLVEAYMSMIYDILTSMNTQVGLAKSLQIKISGLRGTVSAVGKDEPIQQAKDINEALKAGRSVLLDKNDQVETLKLDSTSVEGSMNLVYGQLAADIGMPLSFVTGELATGMSATGEADTNQQEEGLQDFFNSIFKPSCDKLYGWNLRFVSDDWRYFSQMIGSLIIVENSGLLSDDQKKAFADRLMPISN